jgi:glyoxylase-like metal-dependent hydrolase (beta-lactamase superfamily II)
MAGQACTASGLRVQELVPHLFAVLGSQGDSNAGFVLGPRGALVIDAMQNEGLGRALLEAVRAAGGDPIRVLVNTHYHGDHVFGNLAFPADIEIVAHARSCAVMAQALAAAEVGPEQPLPERTLMELTFGRNLYELVPEGDPGREFFRWRFAAGGLAGARLRLPTLAVEGECTFHLGGRRMVLRHLGPGHTDGDLVAWFPDDGVIFVADLLFHGRFPWLGDSDVPAWITRLEEVARLGAHTVVPGHGEPVGVPEVVAFRDLLVALVEGAAAAARDGLDERAALDAVRLPAYAHLPRYKEWLPIALRKLYREARPGEPAKGGGE